MIELLLDHGAAKPPRSADDVGIPAGGDEIGQTALLDAIEAYSVEGVRLLLGVGADPNWDKAGCLKKGAVVDRWDGRTYRSQWLPLAKEVELAVREPDSKIKPEGKLQKCTDIMDMLLEAGADPVRQSVTGSDALSAACLGRQDGLLGKLLDHCPEGNVREGRVPALFTAARAGKAELVKLLLGRGVDVKGKLPQSKESLL